MANTKVQSEQIEDGSITADKLADGTIVAAELADNAVTTAKINADAVTGAKIADDAIDSEHYTDGSIDTAHLADAQITVAKMAANSVDSDQYVDGSIDTVHLGDLQVTTAKIANGNISTAKIADNAVTSAKLDTNIDIAGTLDVTGATTLDGNLSLGGADGDNAVLSLTANTGNWVFTNVQSNRNLEISDSDGTGTVFTIDTSGNVGIGTTSPDTELTIVGGIKVSQSALTDSIKMSVNTSSSYAQTITLDDVGLTFDNNSGSRGYRFGNNGAESMRIDSSGRVLIGNTTSSAHANTDDLQVGNTTGNHGIQINAANTGNSSIFFGDNDSTLTGQLEYVHASDYLAIVTGANQRLRIDAHGVKFNVNTAETDALDDYEEGSWTIAVSSSDPTGMTATPSNAYGWYVKVGKVVHVGGSFDLSVSNGQGTMRITGLPYACSSNGTRPLFTGQVGYTINVVPQPGYITIGNGSTSDYIDVWREGNNTRYNIVDWDSGGRMNFQITYEAN